MNIIEYPFSSCKFTALNTIMLDTCFILTILYDTDPKNSECCNTVTKLKLSNCPLYVTDMVIAEAINQITKKLFMNDMKYKIEKIQPINTLYDIDLIVACFSKHDRKIIKERKLEHYKDIPFNKYFYNIAKNPWKKDLLKIYFNKSIELCSYVEKTLNLKYLSIDKDCMDLAKKFVNNYMLSINDAFHLACAENNSIQYFLTLDKDFESSIKSSTTILKI